MLSAKEVTEMASAIREEWLRHGLSTEPADRPAAEAAIADAYSALGMPAPRIVWADSPAAGVAVVTQHGPVNGRTSQLHVLRERIHDAVWRAAGAGTRADRFRRAWDTPAADVFGPIEQRVGGVRDAVRQTVVDRIRDHIRGEETRRQAATVTVWNGIARWAIPSVMTFSNTANVPTAIDVDWARRAWHGQHEAAWMGHYLVGCRALEMPPLEGLDALTRLAQSAGWVWTLPSVAVLTERPGEMHRDVQGRLHNETGPAVRYPDDFAVWAWHGVAVPQNLVEGRWSTRIILNDMTSADVRRCAIEKLGWDRFIAEAGLNQVGKPVPDPGNPGHELALYELPWGLFNAHMRVVMCDNATPERDGTRRRFGLTVPSEVTDPIAAVAWTFNLTAPQYRKLQHAY